MPLPPSRTRTATFAASDVRMCSIPDIQNDEVESLNCGTEIAVALGKSETLGTVEGSVLLIAQKLPPLYLGRDFAGIPLPLQL
jgi:hypothetical protein